MTPSLSKVISRIGFFILICLYSISVLASGIPTPNDFSGSDTERIRKAVDAAKGTTNKVIIPALNANGTIRIMKRRYVQ